MENSGTILELKTAFIRNQVRILSTAITPQDGWRDFAPETEDDLSEKVVEEALQKCSLDEKEKKALKTENDS